MAAKGIAAMMASIVAVLAIGCRQQADDACFVAVDATGWDYGNVAEFHPADSVWKGNVALLIKHTTAYPYSNLWLEVTYPGLRTDTLNITLADDFGNWRGKANGLSVTTTDTIAHGLTLNNGTIKLRHVMRTDRLPQIEQIGMVFISQ